MVQAGQVIDNLYQIIGEIGHGAAGVVYCAYHLRLCKYVVLKRIKHLLPDYGVLRNEVDILKGLHHMYLPQVYDFLEYNGALYSVMDYIEGRDMEAMLREGCRPTEEELLRWLRELTQVLSYLHRQRPAIVHGDIKPSNIIVRPNGDICLIDFGVSMTNAEDGQIYGYTGQYAAPEQLARAHAQTDGGDTGAITVDARSDIYSLGATFYHIMHSNAPDQYEKDDRQDTSPYSKALASVIERAMQPDPRDRFSSAERLGHELERLAHKTDGYRKLQLLRLLCGFASALLIAVGGLLCMHGAQQRTEDALRSDYYSMRAQFIADNADATIRSGLEILQAERYQTLLEKEDETRSAICHMLGECYYQEERYGLAAVQFESALKGCPEDKRGAYYSDYALALAWSGETEQAASALARARLYGEDTQTKLIYAELSCLRGEYETAGLAAREVLGAGATQEEQCRAYLLLAEIARRRGDGAEMLRLLQTAQPLLSEKLCCRKMGQAYILAANALPAGTERNAHLAGAQECYSLLCAMSYPSYADRLNLAIVQQELGAYADSVETLLPLLEEGENYRTYMYLAFACESLRRQSEAAEYCTRAKQLYDAASDGEALWSDSIQALLALYEKYG